MNVKVVDFKSQSFSKDFTDSLKNTGFAVLTNHGIPFSLIRATQDAWKKFFIEMPQSYRDSYVNSKDRNMGYKGFKSETAVGSNKADLKSFYHYKPQERLPSIADNETFSMFYLLENLGFKLVDAIDKDLKSNMLKECRSSDKTILRVLHYPAMDFSIEEGAVRAAAHEDINLITLLVAATAPGLQVLDQKGQWLDVPFQENSIIVNVGDMLQLLTDGKYKSTTHRVINPQNSLEDRISMPLFMHPNSDMILKDGFTAGAYLEERIRQIYGENK
jgi:isopenicillin N synthase-like dioxygenase